MAVRIVIDIAEDDLLKIAKNAVSALAFVQAISDNQDINPLEKGVTISASPDARVRGCIKQHGVIAHQYDYYFGYGRYYDDQADVTINGVNGTEGQCFVRKASPSTHSK